MAIQKLEIQETDKQRKKDILKVLSLYREFERDRPALLYAAFKIIQTVDGDKQENIVNTIAGHTGLGRTTIFTEVREAMTEPTLVLPAVKKWLERI